MHRIQNQGARSKIALPRCTISRCTTSPTTHGRLSWPPRLQKTVVLKVPPGHPRGDQQSYCICFAPDRRPSLPLDHWLFDHWAIDGPSAAEIEFISGPLRTPGESQTLICGQGVNDANGAWCQRPSFKQKSLLS